MDAFRNVKGERIPFATIKNLNSKVVLSSMKVNIQEGQRYVIEFTWRVSGDRHIVTVQKVDGRLIFYDPQNGRVRIDALKYIGAFNLNSSIYVARVDNAIINPQLVQSHIVPVKSISSSK